MLNPTLIWLIAGAILCLMELIFPSAFVEFMMGIAALLVAAVSFILPHHTLLIALWLIFSTGLIILSRRFLTPKRRITDFGDDKEGETITAIAPGTAGRVLYEGNSWRAKCADPLTAIAPNQKVYVVSKEGNTLIVLPENLLNS